jgi:hypothetical protein
VMARHGRKLARGSERGRRGTEIVGDGFLDKIRLALTVDKKKSLGVCQQYAVLVPMKSNPELLGEDAAEGGCWQKRLQIV